MMIQLENVTKTYKGGNGLQNISMKVKKGGIYALCGGNGAGKSTLIQLLIGAIALDTGKIHLNEAANSCAFMPDDLEFPDQMTGLEVLRFLGQLQKSSEEKIQQLLVDVGLSGEGNKKVKNYSKGMKQRLSFAQSLLSDTPLYILDEPTNGLDPYWVKKWKERILEEREKGRTIIFSTHILPIVEELADYVLFLHKGKKLVSGSVSSLRANYNGDSLEEIFFEEIVKEQSREKLR